MRAYKRRASITQISRSMENDTDTVSVRLTGGRPNQKQVVSRRKPKQALFHVRRTISGGCRLERLPNAI